jgi:tripartite ATP-independent transporter DctP family solute receptor
MQGEEPMKYGIFKLSSLIVGATFLIGATQFVQAQEYTLRLSTVISQSDPLFKGYEQFAAAVGKRSNGAIKVEVFPDAQLGQDEDVMEQALLGADVAFNTDAGRLGVRVPEMGIILAPYLFENPLQAKKLFGTDLYKGWAAKLEKEHGLVVLALNYYVGGRHFLTKKPIMKPEDLKGLKVRTPGSPVWQETIRALGATPVALPWIETYPALQQGVVDGAEAQHPGTIGSKLHEVAPHISKTGHILLMNGPVVGAKWFNSLPKELQAMLIEEALAAGEWTTKTVMESEGDIEAQMVKEGAIVTQPDVVAFRKAAQSAYEVLKLSDLKAKVEEVLAQ